MMLPDDRATGCAWIGESTSGAPAAKASITSRASPESVSVSESASMAASCADNGGSAVRSAARPLGDAEAQVAFVGGPLLWYRPVDIRRRLAEQREPRTDAAGGVVDDAIGSAAHVSRRNVPEALSALVDEAYGLLPAERANVRERHQDAGAAAVAELVLEVQLPRHEVGRACSAAKRRAPAGGAGLWRGAEPHAHHSGLLGARSTIARGRRVTSIRSHAPSAHECLVDDGAQGGIFGCCTDVRCTSNEKCLCNSA
eukprot:scaffold67549_cov64-Phaeocystis_antarctica.AAC.2